MTKRKLRRYNRWAGNPDGTLEDPDRCIASVPTYPVLTHQCLRKRGHGPNGEYCRQHAKMVDEGRHVWVPK